MILTGSKYGSVRTSGRRAGGPNGKWQTPTQSGANGKSGGEPKAPSLFVPSVTGARSRSLRDWYWKEIKEGGFLYEYLAKEKRRGAKMLRSVARVMDGFQQNNKSDFRLVAAVPARLYQRWKAEDSHFFEDNSNLRSLRRDNPDACVYL